MAIHHNINIGERFHHLVVKSPPFRKPDKYWYMECNCDCGNVKAVKCKDAVSGHIKSCGCWSRNRPRSGRVTHGKSCTPTWWSYRGMLTRCYNPKQPSFKEYGARGITVCQRWLAGFENFLADMGERPPGKTLDRYPDNDGNYEPGNCRWATTEEQRNNKQDSHYLAFNGKRLTIEQWAKATGIGGSTIRVRLKLNWPIERILSVPARLGRNQYSSN